MDSIDRLATLVKGGDDDDDAYMLGYRDARAGKPPKPAAPGGEPDGGGEAAEGGEDRDGDGDADEPGTDVDGNGAEPEEGTDQDGDGANDASAAAGDKEDPDGEGAVADEDAGAMGNEDRNDDQQPDGEAVDDEAQPGDGDGEDIDLPEDDGENHGAGDLNEDGEAQSLLQEVASVERDYYAAAGMHGAGHHKTVKALDIYHRVVRKLVRALMGEGEDIDGDGAPEGHPDDAEGEDGEGANGEGESDGGKDKAPPFGAKGKGDKKSKSKDGGKPPFGGDKSKSDDDSGKPFGGDKSKSEGDDDSGGESDDEEKKPKKPPFGKSFDAFDRLALLSDDPRAILDVLEKGGVFSREDGKIVKAGPGSRETKHVRVRDEQPTTTVKPEKKFGQPQLAYRDMLKSDPLARGAEGVQVVRPEPDHVQLIDDRGGPILRKSVSQKFVSRDTPVAITVNAACPIHGHSHESIYKSQLLVHGHLPCTCKR